MDHFAGLDVSVKDTSICIVDDTGRITRDGGLAEFADVNQSTRKSFALCLNLSPTKPSVSSLLRAATSHRR
jgi:hypothetical protein